MNTWFNDAFFYHIYPLGFCGAEKNNNLYSQPIERLNKVGEWIPHLKDLGVNALYLGPIFESETHGYDTVNYFMVDRRLGTNSGLKELIQKLHENGIRIILDGVFNHTGRAFFAFQDLLKNKWESQYKEWYLDVDFSKRSPNNDPFSYQGWAGHYNLVKLNLNNHLTREHLFDAVRMWIKDFDIDGLRLDAADVIDHRFLSDLTAVTKHLKNDFFLTGEVVHGDYSKWACPGKLDSTTNYECFKGLYSSLNDKNYFEIAYALKRQFGDGGIYKGLPLYNFTDNHDVDRVASTIKNRAHLYPLYGLLFTMPGIPSLYYGSEWGVGGKRTNHSDAELRPEIDLGTIENNPPEPALKAAIKKLGSLRRNTPALKYGHYKELLVSSSQMAFERSYNNERIVVALNSENTPKEVTLKNYNAHSGYDLLNNENVDIHKIVIPANWLRVIKVN